MNIYFLFCLHTWNNTFPDSSFILVLLKSICFKLLGHVPLPSAAAIALIPFAPNLLFEFFDLWLFSLFYIQSWFFVYIHGFCLSRQIFWYSYYNIFKLIWYCLECPKISRMGVSCISGFIAYGTKYGKMGIKSFVLTSRIPICMQKINFEGKLRGKSI